MLSESIVHPELRPLLQHLSVDSIDLPLEQIIGPRPEFQLGGYSGRGDAAFDEWLASGPTRRDLFRKMYALAPQFAALPTLSPHVQVTYRDVLAIDRLDDTYEQAFVAFNLRRFKGHRPGQEAAGFADNVNGVIHRLSQSTPQFPGQLVRDHLIAVLRGWMVVDLEWHGQHFQYAVVPGDESRAPIWLTPSPSLWAGRQLIESLPQLVVSAETAQIDQALECYSDIGPSGFLRRELMEMIPRLAGTSVPSRTKAEVYRRLKSATQEMTTRNLFGEVDPHAVDAVLAQAMAAAQSGIDRITTRTRLLWFIALPLLVILSWMPFLSARLGTPLSYAPLVTSALIIFAGWKADRWIRRG